MKKIAKKDIYNDNYGWLDTYHHFSFGNYYDPHNRGFGDIRVINDDIVLAGNGFGAHPHEDMEIITYIIEGEMTHGDSMENEKTIGPEEIQYMSAGTGVYHSEYNRGDKPTRLLQIWIYPDKKGYEPVYRNYKYDPERLKNNFYPVVSGRKGEGLINIRQDADIFVGKLDEDKVYTIPEGKKVYGVVIEGRARINGEVLQARDAFTEEGETIEVEVDEKAHIILLQTRK